MSVERVGAVMAIAVRTEENGPMALVEEATAKPGAGLDGDLQCAADREISFISQPQWQEALKELGMDLPWHTRRANVLLDAPSLGELVGATLTLGKIRVKITQECSPCGLMDKLQPGLRAVLKPECRGGILGTIVGGGTFRVGDIVEKVESS